MTNIQKGVNDDDNNFNDDEPKLQSYNNKKSGKKHKPKAGTHTPKCVEKTVTVRKFITPIAQPYDLEKCKNWINTYPYGGGPHNCCGELWNENIRYKRDRVTTGGRVVEIGANQANDAINGIIEIYKPKVYHAAEPVPSFVKTIKERFAAHPNIELHVHQFAIADKAAKAYVQEAGQATHISGGTTGTEIDIKAAKDAVKMFGLNQETALLHINCEGCEYSFLEAAIENDYIKNVAILQFGTHLNMNGVSYAEAKKRYCQINAHLAKTHTLDPESKPWAWDRWIRMEKQEVEETSTTKECEQ